MKHPSLSAFAMEDPAGFVRWCDTLRAAGVVKLGALVLGAKPRDPSASDKDTDPDAEARRKHEIMFASSRIKPPFIPSRTSEAGYPAAVRERLARDGTANGTTKP